jgi:alpha-L-fucosidase
MMSECTTSDRTACFRNRTRCKDAALTLFVGGGESYEVDGVRHEPVKMEATSIAANGTKSIRTNPMRVYFQRLIALVSGEHPRYTKVTLTSGEVYEIRVGNLHQINDNLYECVATFGQWFYGECGEIVVYKDYTEKSVKCYIKIIVTCTGKEFETLLGDTKCGESHQL